MVFNLFGGDVDRPPAPEVADAEDVQQYTLEWARHHPRAATEASRAPRTDPEEAPFAKQAGGLGENTTSRAEFPWLHDPNRGVRWDFDPIELRNLAQTNTWVGMLVQSITKEVAETPWTIAGVDDRHELQKRAQTTPTDRQPLDKALPDAIAERIYELLRQPNPDQSWHDLVEMWLGDLLEVGSAATVKAYPTSAYQDDEFVADPQTVKPRALQASAPEVWTKDFHDRTGIIEGYWQFDDHNSPGTGSPEDTRIGTRGIRHPTFFDRHELLWSDMTPRSNRRYGIPPTLLVRDFLRSLDLAVTQEQQYLSRGSIPSGAWVFEQWDREEVKEWKEENAENVKGKPHKSLMFAGRGGDVRFEAMSMNFSELEFTERMKWYARVVASAFQVPTAVVGIEPERVNYNTFQGERENFESNTLGPYLQKLERLINGQLIHPHWGSDYRFEFKPGMSETTRQMISDRVRGEFDAGLRRRNEARRELGLDPVDEEFDGFQDEVVEDTAPTDALDDALAMAAHDTDEDTPTDLGKATDSTVIFDNAGGEAFEDRGTLIRFLSDLDAVADGGVFVGGAQYPELERDLAGADVQVVGIAEREAHAVWAQYRDLAVALSGPTAVDADAPRRAEASLDKQSGPFDDYPEAAVENARMALAAREETGNPNDCGTRVGWERANQLDNREALSEETVSRMAAFERHEDNKEQDEEGRADCGWMMWQAWGGDEGIEWAQDKLDEIERGDTSEQSAGGSGNEGESVRKDEPLRNTDDWEQFTVQPEMVDELHADIADDVRALFDAVLEDDEIQSIIERLAVDDPDDDGETTAKSLTELGRRLTEIFDASEVVARIEDAISEHTADAARAALADAVTATDEDPDVDVDAIDAQLRDREVEFANRFANELRDEIRATVGDGWAAGKNSREIAQDIADQANISEGWTGAERIARQELQIATGEARSEFADEIDKIEIWQTSEDDRVRPAHEDMNGSWKRPGENWTVDYSEEGRGVQTESVPGDSPPGIGCRCTVLLRDRDAVDDDDYAGDGALN